jgi:hypothetical protein
MSLGGFGMRSGTGLLSNSIAVLNLAAKLTGSTLKL